jgi:hypothetical protein
MIISYIFEHWYPNYSTHSHLYAMITTRRCTHSRNNPSYWVLSVVLSIECLSMHPNCGLRMLPLFLRWPLILYKIVLSPCSYTFFPSARSSWTFFNGSCVQSMVQCVHLVLQSFLQGPILSSLIDDQSCSGPLWCTLNCVEVQAWYQSLQSLCCKHWSSQVWLASHLATRFGEPSHGLCSFIQWQACSNHCAQLHSCCKVVAYRKWRWVEQAWSPS